MSVAPRTPAGNKLEDGYQCVLTFASDATIALWEKSVTPPGADGGEKVDTTTMHNNIVRTYSPRSLKEITDGKFSAAYDPAVLTEILALINVPDNLTWHFPDGSKWTQRGYLRSFAPGTLEEGTQPMAECVVVTTNTSALGAEVVPAYVAPTA